MAATPDWTWLRTEAPNRAFSAETPCTASEIERLRQTPGDLGRLQVPAGQRIACLTEGVVFLAGIIEASESEVQTGSLFDQILEQAETDPTKQGVATESTIDGRRAWLNRETREEVVAQTGVVEISRTKILLVISGADESAELSSSEQAAAIDRFYASIKFAGG